ncbi:glycosyltransferase, partial [Proteus mirabilis]
IKHLDYLIVQAEWLKESIIKKLNFPRKNIFIIKPKVNINPNKNFTIVNNTLKNKDFNILFYPAYGHEYKNHKIIIDSIKEIGIKYLEKNNVRIVFTIEENHKLAQEIKKTSLNKYFIFTGKISREKVFYYYRLAKIVLFPSVLETYGLPLKEALVLNKNIIVSRLPYAEEVLSNYNKAIFCNPYNRIDWISNIKKLLENKEINFYNREQEEVNSNNNEFLSLIKKLIKE